MKKRVQKGFTLIELIIVMALFSIVMYGVLQFLDPVTKFFVRSSNFETTTSCIDNMKRAIEGNLKYADRVRAFAGFDATTIDGNVEDFWEDFFKDRELMDCKGNIYVMAFDNRFNRAPHGTLAGGSPFWTFDDLSNFNKDQYNSGKITLMTYNFDKTGYDLADSVDWYVNQKLYSNFNYTFEMGAGTGSFATPGVDATFNPSDCTITIRSKEVVSDKSTPGRWIESETENINVASFSMKNVLDPTNHYTTPLNDFKVIRNPDATHDSYSVTNNKFKYIIESVNVGGTDTPVPHSRYEALKTNASAPPDFTNFYFIFTQAETVYDAGERIFNAGKFVKPTHPYDDPYYDQAYATQVQNAYPT